MNFRFLFLLRYIRSFPIFPSISLVVDWKSIRISTIAHKNTDTYLIETMIHFSIEEEGRHS